MADTMVCLCAAVVKKQTTIEVENYEECRRPRERKVKSRVHLRIGRLLVVDMQRWQTEFGNVAALSNQQCYRLIPVEKMYD
jgi:hypothetical protein